MKDDLRKIHWISCSIQVASALVETVDSFSPMLSEHHFSNFLGIPHISFSYGRKIILKAIRPKFFQTNAAFFHPSQFSFQTPSLYCVQHYYQVSADIRKLQEYWLN